MTLTPQRNGELPTFDFVDRACHQEALEASVQIGASIVHNLLSSHDFAVIDATFDGRLDEPSVKARLSDVPSIAEMEAVSVLSESLAQAGLPALYFAMHDNFKTSPGISLHIDDITNPQGETIGIFEGVSVIANLTHSSMLYIHEVVGASEDGKPVYEPTHFGQIPLGGGAFIRQKVGDRDPIPHSSRRLGKMKDHRRLFSLDPQYVVVSKSDTATR